MGVKTTSYDPKHLRIAAFGLPIFAALLCGRVAHAVEVDMRERQGDERDKLKLAH